VITRMVVGGAQENTLASCVGLRHHGYDVDLVTGPQTGAEGSLLEEVEKAGIPAQIVPSLRREPDLYHDFCAYRGLRKLFRHQRYQIVHTHSGKAGFLGRLAAKAARVPIIVHTIHGPSFYPDQNPIGNWLFTWAEKLVGECTSQFVSVADAMTEKYLGAGIGMPSRYVTIRSGMNIRSFTSAKPDTGLRASLGIADDDIVIGKVARLFDRKGHAYLFEAAPRIWAAHPNVKFLLVGDGKYRKRFERHVKKMGMRDQFVFTGLVPPREMPRYFALMDVLVHLSLREGLARALPQALAAGVPVIAFDQDGAREVCVHGETGLLVRAGDADGLYGAVLELLRDRKLAVSMGQRGRGLVSEQYSEERMVEQIDGLYQQLMKGWVG